MVSNRRMQGTHYRGAEVIGALLSCETTLNEWNMRGGGKMLVKIESLGRTLSLKDKRAFQRNLRNFSPPGNTLASQARGFAHAYR